VLVFLQSCARAVLAVTVFLIVPSPAAAQQIGVKAGLNFASLTPEEDESPDTSPRRGLVAGFWIRTPPVTARLSIQAEGLFSEKGVHINTFPFAPNAIGSGDVRVRYIEIPVLARGDLRAPNMATGVYVLGGAAPAFRLSARSRVELDGEEQTADNSDDIEPWDLGLVGGAGIEFGRVAIEARYTHGILKINVDDNDPEDRIQNRVFSVTVGVRLR
jgi:hypothetical protein